MKIRQMGAELFHVGWQKDGQTERHDEDIVAFLNSAIAPYKASAITTE